MGRKVARKAQLSVSDGEGLVVLLMEHLSNGDATYEQVCRMLEITLPVTITDIGDDRYELKWEKQP
jgi:hypothetical protein